MIGEQKHVECTTTTDGDGPPDSDSLPRYDMPHGTSEEEEEEAFKRWPANKRSTRVRRNYPPKEKGQFPMLEVAGHDGPTLVYRHWNEKDLKEAMGDLSDPVACSTQWGVEIHNFRPTVNKLQRLIQTKMEGKYHIVRNYFTPALLALRLKQVDWEHVDNAPYRDAITGLVRLMAEKFPHISDMTAVNSLRQKPKESVDTFLACLTSSV